MSAPFDLRALAREVINDDTSEDLAQMVKELRRRIPRAAIGDALDQALTAFVHDMIRKPDAGRSRDVPPPAASAKVTAIREAWRRHLDTIRYTVGDGSIRRLGDMSAGDVIFVAEHLELLARQNQARADWMNAWADALAKHNAARVRDLPDDVKRGMFAKQAA